jgi:hypothetical protein
LTARVRFLSVEQVIALHDTLVDRYGGHPGGGARGLSFEGVDAAVQAVRNSYYEGLHIVDDRDPDPARALGLADLFCRTARRKVRSLFRDSGQTRMPGRTASRRA